VRQPIGDHVDHYRDGDAQPTNARGSAHLIGAHGDSREPHNPKVARSLAPVTGSLSLTPRLAAGNSRHGESFVAARASTTGEHGSQSSPVWQTRHGGSASQSVGDQPFAKPAADPEVQGPSLCLSADTSASVGSILLSSGNTLKD
jgi:hypothetical protein